MGSGRAGWAKVSHRVLIRGRWKVQVGEVDVTVEAEAGTVHLVGGAVS